jgi:CopG family transcriptional regulator, nickel-responsive regulator
MDADLKKYQLNIKKPGLMHNISHRKVQVKRISISLSPKLLAEFSKSMQKAGFTDRSKAIQAALYSFINEYDWKSINSNNANGAGAIIILYDNHIYNQDTLSTQIQHEYKEIISAATHLHLEDDNCLEAIMVNGDIKRIKELASKLSENRGIKSVKVHFASLV